LSGLFLFSSYSKGAKPIASKGSALKLGDGGSPEVFTTVAEVLNISGPQLDSETIDVTNMDSPGSYREFLQSFKNAGTVTFGINFQPNISSHSGLVSLFNAGTKRNWKIVFPNVAANEWQFNGYIKSINNNFDPGSQIKADITIQVSGQSTLV
jgi:predicted secreted protein